jgi:Peptidase A4 family
MLRVLGMAALAAAMTAAALPATAHAAVPQQHERPAAACSVDPSNSVWAGYVACGSSYASVSATWTQPQVSCTSNGTVGFWVGLDGYGETPIEQTGINVSCATGTPKYTGFWESSATSPAINYNEPVYPGDTIVANVLYQGSDTYSLQLTDSTRDWVEITPLDSVAPNLSAEVIAEATTVNGQVTALPNFTAIQFRQVTIDDVSLSSAGAQPTSLVNSDGQDLAYPASLTGNGFTDFYAGWVGSAVAAAFAGSNSHLYTYSSPGLDDTTYPILGGTSPAIALLSNGTYEIAYQSSAGYLTLFNSGTVTSTGLAMKSGTSPAIAAQAGGSYQVAYQSSSGSMWTYTPSAGGVNQSQGMLAGTSPAITALASGGYEMAFQANTGILIVYGSGGDINTSLGMKAGTSPSIGAAGGGFEAAMQANTGVLWTYGTNGTADLGLGMASGTSPAIAGLTTGGYEMAFQTNTGVLEVYGQAASLNTGVGMSAGTSPSIAAQAGGGYETAIRESTGQFSVYGTAGIVQTNALTYAGTSSSVAG